MDDDELFTRYEFSIPVLKSNVTGAEIRWPFSIKAISLFLSTNQ